MILLVVAAGAAQALDLLTFAAAVARHGSGGESNPVMAAAYDHAGLWGAAAVKGGAFFLALLTVYAIEGAGGPAWVGAAVLGFAVAAGLLGAATNLWVLR